MQIFFEDVCTWFATRCVSFLVSWRTVAWADDQSCVMEVTEGAWGVLPSPTRNWYSGPSGVVRVLLVSIMGTVPGPPMPTYWPA